MTARARNSIPDAAVAGLLAAGSLALYLATLFPGVPPLDGGDFATAALVHGVAHPPGYPVFTLLGSLFARVPLGEPAARVNAVSAVAAAAAVALLFATARELGIARTAAAAGAATLAVLRGFWRFAVGAEVPALHTALALGIVLLVLRWRRTGAPAALAGIGALFGLGVGHLHTLVLLVPCAAWLVLRAPHRPGPRAVALGAAGVALGLLPLAYLPLAAAAHPPLNQGDPETLSRLVDVLLRRSYGTLRLASSLGGARWSNGVGHLAAFASHTADDLLWIGVLPAMLGAFALWRRNRTVAGALLAWLVLGVPVFLFAADLPPQPAYVFVLSKQFGGVLAVLALFVAAGIDALARRPGVAAACLLLPAAMLVRNHPVCDASEQRLAGDFAALVLRSVDRGAVVLSCYDSIAYPLHYRRDALGERPDVVLAGFLAGAGETGEVARRLPELSLPAAEGVDFMQALVPRAVAAGRPVYTTFTGACGGRDALGGLRGHLVPQGVVYRVLPEPTPAAVTEAAQRGLAMLDEATPASFPPDPASQEFRGWYREAWTHLARAFESVGLYDQARACAARAAALAPGPG